jgi:hypothetical protein
MVHSLSSTLSDLLNDRSSKKSQLDTFYYVAYVTTLKFRIKRFKTVVRVFAYAAAECHSCSGTDQILANGISRTTTGSQFCAAGGPVNSSPQFTFFRVPPVYPCTVQASEMERRMELNARGMLFADEVEQ